MTKTFLLGVGAQKAGTTWLYQFLRHHPECNMGTIKEYAVFDTALRPDLSYDRQRLRLRSLQHMARNRANRAETGQAYAESAELLDLMDSIALACDLDRYVPYFDRLISARPGLKLVGDITPSYTALRAPEFARIRDLLTAGGYRVKVVLLMRDPVERCYSAIRMADRNAAKQGGPGPARPAEERFVDEALAPWCEIRTRYDQTIEALEEVFPAEDIHYDFFETFIAPDPVAALTGFLGISAGTPNFSHRSNASPRLAEPSPEALAQVRAHYAPTYDFCRARFGAELIDRIWKHA